jgi:hypothetical protein
VSYFQKCRKTLAQPNGLKMKMKITLKTAIKAKKGLTKMLKNFVGNKRNETNVFQLCCGQRAYVGYVGWKNLCLKITLKWLQGCQ